jgi:hypothetical protein
VWEWGKTYYSVKASQIGLMQAEDAQVQIRDTVTLEVKNAFLNMQESEKNIKVTQTAISSAEENFRLNEAGIRNRWPPQPMSWTPRPLLTQAQINYYNALSDYNIARAQLERANGRGKTIIIRQHPASGPLFRIRCKVKHYRYLLLIFSAVFLSGCALFGFGSAESPEQELFDEIMTAYKTAPTKAASGQASGFLQRIRNRG